MDAEIMLYSFWAYVKTEGEATVVTAGDEDDGAIFFLPEMAGIEERCALRLASCTLKSKNYSLNDRD